VIRVVPIEERHIAGFHQALVRNGVPQIVALDGEVVVGWCDICPSGKPAFSHCGTLGMGVLPAYRHQGLGTRLLAAAMARARESGLERVELEVYESNAPAIALYRKLGFQQEGRKVRSCRIDGVYENDLLMALFL
jgi:ribosomal protein S18 acetylase RimI-like enzyme